MNKILFMAILFFLASVASIFLMGINFMSGSVFGAFVIFFLTAMRDIYSTKKGCDKSGNNKP